MIQHIVEFKFEGSAEERKARAERFKAALLALPAQIDELKGMSVGINENPAEEWDLVLIALAESLEDVAAYSAHPAHVAAVRDCIAGHVAGRACVDCRLTEDGK